MNWVKLIPSILKFLFDELPRFIEQLKLAAKDKKHASNIARYQQALSKFYKEKDLDALNQLSE